MKSFAVLGALVFGVFFMPHQGVLAADSVTMPVQVRLLQCGARAEIKASCEKDARCCVFLDSPLREIHVAAAEASHFKSELSYSNKDERDFRE